ncbi:ATP synthase F0 subunit B [Patescibacteria group bacterium]|nr:ATP synthase F0 subunit B [Patescibacteria group bacterium]
MDILQQFGINGKLLIVQLINFAVLVFVIWKLVLPRLTKLMDERKRSIEEQLKAAEDARKEVEASKAAREREQDKAAAEATALLKDAKDQADRTRTELLNAAKKDADALRARTEEQLAVEREKLRAELRAEVASLTIETTRKVLSDVVKPTDQKKMVAEAAKYLKKQEKVRGK